jgi:hypothetical protein
MTRTQISLEDIQYLYLKTQAAARGSSLSAVIRDLIDSDMGAQRAEGPRLEEMAGLFSGGDLEGVDHDHYLYGWPKRSAEPDA